MIAFLKRWLLAMASVIGVLVVVLLACWALLAAANTFGWGSVALTAFLGGTAIAALAQQANKDAP